MTEDDLDLEDDDLDLGGDDFAGELDDMMGDDELGGDSGGGDDSDSELDSFFEDLSSIEDMDEGAPEPSGASMDVDDMDDDVEDDAPVKKVEKVKKEKSKGDKEGGSKLKIILPILLLLFGGIGGGAWYFLRTPEPLQVEDIEIIEEPPVQMIEIEKPVIQKPVQPMIEAAPPAPKPVTPVVPKTKWLVQVATCTYDVCKEDYVNSLRKDGEPVFQRASGEKYDFIELISNQVFSYRDAHGLVKRINTRNKMAGNASVKSQSNGYRISMGSFPALDRAKEVKFNIEGIFPQKNVTFNLEHVRKGYTTTKIFAGPYDSRSVAKKVLAELRSKEKYRGAYIVRY